MRQSFVRSSLACAFSASSLIAFAAQAQSTFPYYGPSAFIAQDAGQIANRADSALIDPPSPSDMSADEEGPTLAELQKTVAELQEQIEKIGQEPEDEDEEEAWYDKLSLRGYAQFRTNEVLNTGPDSASPQHVGDASIREDQNFFIRRARLIVFGDVSDHVYVYLQTDFAVTPPDSPDAIHFAQMRDWYADLYLDTTKIHRIRVGQSKIPYGFENLQSSQNRIPLDRSDSFNSAARNERDLGVFYYYTPEYVQDVFTFLSDNDLKGSGNYGMFGIGVYNGQGGSLAEQNDNLHSIARFALPFFLYDCQVVELGVQGYTGRYTVLGSEISPLGVGPAVIPLGTEDQGNQEGIRDERVGGTFVYYPQPFGFQSEWNVGRGPGLNDAQTEVIERSLGGGYAMIMYRHKTACYGNFTPFLRYNQYQGGYKPERNSPYAHIEEWETGVEWQIGKHVELTTQYTLTDRTNTRAISDADRLSYRQFEGEILRFQLQVNY
ncbi:MAG TPA: porin [Pirellulaceae bacterium]|nr:porin [Pirellulaceae bacterium]